MKENKKIRLFIALPLPDNIHKLLDKIQQSLKKSDAHVKWCKPENIHLTLKFLGYTDESLLFKVKKRLNEALKDYSPFKISLDKEIGAFPNLFHPRVLWLGIDSGIIQLRSMQHKLNEFLEDLEFGKEKRTFEPHLTLGRIKSLKSKDDLIDNVKKIHLEKEYLIKVSKICLFQSILMTKGPIYKILYEVRLS